MRLNALLEVRQGSNMLDPANAARMLALGGGEELKALTNAQTANLAREKQSVELPITQWSQFRDELAALDPSNQAGYQAWVARVVSAAPWAARLLPPTIDANSQRRLLMTAESALPKGEVRGIGGGTATINQYTGEQIGSTIMNVPEPADVFAQKERVAAASAGKNITVQERAEQGKYGELLVANYARLQERAESGRRFLSTIEQAKRSLAEGLRTGFGADTIRLGARVLAALGEPEAEKKAANADLFLAAVKENVLRRQIEQKGPQTESDAQRIEETFIRLGTPTLANEFMLDVANAQIKRDSEQQRFFDKWRRDTGSFDGAEEAWLDSEGGRSLFERSELKKYATPEGASGMPKIGDVVDGYKFKGGDPANPKSWVKER
jgi:hypothetical protein